ncbi:MAG TPA: phosphoribosylglycinamide formyltransferase [Woeseiaceae bacterium]|nr:phosphoribosylglycinamide formyltransferase [Woeseiaceae bacterium]
MTQAGSKLRTAVLVSGGGSNLQAIIDSAQRGELDIELVVVLSDKPEAYGLVRAREAGIATGCILPADHPRRESFDAALLQQLDRYRPGLVLLAGFMRILTPAFVSHYSGRLLNIHPSLLPGYPGLHTHRRVLEAGERWHGCTVHFVTETLDGGPRIIQGRVPVLPDDDAERLAQRVLAVEHRIYPEAIRLLSAGRVRYADGAAWLDGKRLDEPLQLN